MSIFDYFKKKNANSSASMAKERLQIIVAHERRGRNKIQPDFLLNFQHTIQHLQDSQSIVKDAMQHFKEKVIIEKEQI